MKLWTVRAGKYGEQEQTCVDNSVITIAWNEMPDLKTFKSREELFKEYQIIYKEASNVKAGINAGQIWRFANEIALGDIVALPSKTQPSIYIGKIIGEYKYQKVAPDTVHLRPVKWLKTIPRAEFDQDILYSFGSLLTISQVSRVQAAERVIALVEGKKRSTKIDTPLIEETEEEFDVEQFAKDQIIKLIDRNFKGHVFAKLVDQILIAQGYITQVSPPGPDGGLDILAASGGLGFDHPRICVQIKSTTAQVDVKTLRELQGVMRKVKSELGLLVSWSGFNHKVLQEAREDFFFIRLWSANDIIENIFKYYENFSDEMKAELPLKRFWMLVEK
ncbi:restriction endonuclease [Segetibacter aerophilus]|uniref:Restriction endonuclease n=1 Tax=Segetibacter aerophilus TaxID=670293 RepID=A0A512B8N4_9BACT|nr:restriction endonuclease [Segetibacter aerophilus]GEO08320.1 restriction endonuclease [Segetibacter aerophilus]